MHGDHCTRDSYLKVLGLHTGIARVFAFFESDGYSDPSAAWQAFTGTWNWAAPLTTAVPAGDLEPGPVVRPAMGGFTLSGVWRLPSHDGPGAWLALPLGGEQQQASATAAQSGPDLFVVPSKVLRNEVRDGDDVTGRVFRLDDVHVPTGFVTHSAGTPLGAGDAAFLWTAVAGLALGAARRMTDVLAGAAPNAASTAATWSVPPAATAAELAAVLHDERLSLAAAVHGAPSVRQGVPSSVGERLAPLVRQAGNAVHQVVASVYEHVLASGENSTRHGLVGLIEASAPILHQARYVTQLLPPDDRMSLRKAEHGDDRRISG